jgi:hypothetical protein
MKRNFFHQFNPSQMRKSIQSSLEVIKDQRDKILSGKKIKGITLPELDKMIQQYETKLAGSDAGLYEQLH